MPDKLIAELIRASHGEQEMHSYLAFQADRTLIQHAGKIGTEILREVEKVPGACALMSALYLCILRDRLPHANFHMVAGLLFAGGDCVFGKPDRTITWSETLGSSSSDWDGHCWLVCDDYILDISIFRTAYSPKSPPALARAVRTGFGEGRGLLIAQNTSPLLYQPEYVLTVDQVTALGRGADHMFFAEQK